MKKFFGLIIFVLLLSACKTNTLVNKPVDSNTSIASNAEFFRAISTENNFEGLKINSRVNVENGSFIPTLDATVYIEKDKKVWLNLTALFLNAARGIATPKGIQAYERYNKTFIDSDFGYLNNLLNVNFIDLNSLQHLLMGRTFIPINETGFKLNKDSSGYTLSSAKNQQIKSNGKVSEFSVVLNYTSDFNLSKVVLKNAKNNESLEVYYSGFETMNNITLPRNVKIIINGQKKSEILLENTKFDFLKMDTPYSVPNNYKKTDIK